MGHQGLKSYRIALLFQEQSELVHTPSDGDTVFALKLDKPFSSMVTSVNKKSPNMKGGIWVEMICQRPNTSKEEIHKGDCSKPDEMKEFHWPTPHKGDAFISYW